MADALNYILFNNPVSQKIIATSKVSNFLVISILSPESANDKQMILKQVQFWHKYQYNFMNQHNIPA